MRRRQADKRFDLGVDERARSCYYFVALLNVLCCSFGGAQRTEKTIPFYVFPARCGGTEESSREENDGNDENDSFADAKSINKNGYFPPPRRFHAHSRSSAGEQTRQLVIVDVVFLSGAAAAAEGRTPNNRLDFLGEFHYFAARNLNNVRMGWLRQAERVESAVKLFSD